MRKKNYMYFFLFFLEQCSSDISDDKKLEIISNNRPLMHNWNVKSEGTGTNGL